MNRGAVVAMPNRHVLICRCTGAGVLDADAVQRTVELLAGGEIEVTEIDDLCRLAADSNPLFDRLSDLPALAVAACHPRAVRWLLEAAGARLSEETTCFVDLRTPGSGDADVLGRWCDLRLDQDEGGRVSTTARLMPVTDAAQSVAPGEQAQTGWVPWFPVIDGDRCTNCKQCLSFCLFGVYELDAAGQVTPANPRNCKNNCPACARICPENAIIFPKSSEAVINGAPAAAVGAGSPVRVDVDKALEGDLYDILAQRRQRNRQQLLRREQIEQAEAERTACACECDCAGDCRAAPEGGVCECREKDKATSAPCCCG